MFFADASTRPTAGFSKTGSNEEEYNESFFEPTSNSALVVVPVTTDNHIGSQTKIADDLSPLDEQPRTQHRTKCGRSTRLPVRYRPFLHSACLSGRFLRPDHPATLSKRIVSLTFFGL